jgi:hypothetical protein
MALPQKDLALLIAIVAVVITYIPGMSLSLLFYVVRCACWRFRCYNVSCLCFISCNIIIGSPKMYGHMVKTRKNQFEIYKNGGKATDGKDRKKK